MPVAAPSANISGRPSPTCARHVLRDLEGRIHAVIDGEASEIGLESTVVDMTCEQPTVLRPGAVGVREMEEVCGVKFGTGGKMGGAVKSPGMKYRHYAPRAEVRVLEEKNVAAACARARENGACVGLLAGRDVCERLRELDLATVVCGRGDVASYARDLYASLRAFDGETDRTEISASGVNVILAVPPRVERPEDGTYVAVMERLRKAASSMEQAPRHASSQ